MRTIKLKKIALAGLFLLLMGKSIQAAELKLNIVTASFPPLQMDVDGEVKGYVVDLVNLALNKVQEQLPLSVEGPQIVPWRRAMNMAENKPNTIFFSLSRTADREDKFIWLTEVSPYEVYLYKLAKNQDIDAHDLPSLLKSNRRIGVQAGSNTQELLESRGFVKGENFVTYSHFSKGITMLAKNRFAMLPLTVSVGKASVCRQGLDADSVEPVFKLDEISNPLWLVFSKGSDERLVELFRASIEELKSQKIDAEYRKSYLTDWQKSSCSK